VRGASTFEEEGWRVLLGDVYEEKMLACIERKSAEGPYNKDLLPLAASIHHSNILRRPATAAAAAATATQRSSSSRQVVVVDMHTLC